MGNSGEFCELSQRQRVPGLHSALLYCEDSSASPRSSMRKTPESGLRQSVPALADLRCSSAVVQQESVVVLTARGECRNERIGLYDAV